MQRTERGPAPPRRRTPRRHRPSGRHRLRRARRKPRASIRRAPLAQAVPALLQAVTEHTDGYVRFSSLILLTGFNDPRAAEQMVEVLTVAERSVARGGVWHFSSHPRRVAHSTPARRAREREPASSCARRLVRALAARWRRSESARGAAPRRDAGRRLLSQHRHRSARRLQRLAYAVAKLIEVAKLEGPLQDDAVLALGKIGDKQALGTLADRCSERGCRGICSQRSPPPFACSA